MVYSQALDARYRELKAEAGDCVLLMAGNGRARRGALFPARRSSSTELAEVLALHGWGRWVWYG